MFCEHVKKFQTKKTLKLHLELNFHNFQKWKNGKVEVDCYDTLTVGIDIIGFDVHTISKLVFTIPLSISYSFGR